MRFVLPSSLAFSLVHFPALSVAKLGDLSNFPGGGVLGSRAASLEPPIIGVMPGIARPKVIIGGDIDYPPYSFLGANSETVDGFGPDFARAMAMADFCDIDVFIVQTDWERCWNDNKIGEGLAIGEYSGCAAYTHTRGVRNRYLEFSKPILDDAKKAGIISRLNENGEPVVDGMHSLSGVTVVDVVGWAPTQDTLGLVKNSCTQQNFNGFKI